MAIEALVRQISKSGQTVGRKRQKKTTSNIIRQGKRRPEPTHLMTGPQNTKPDIWKKLEDAKRKQESIRKRFRNYGDDEEDSDYGNSPSRHNVGKDSKSNRDDLNTPLEERTKLSRHNTTTSKKFPSLSKGSTQLTRKKSFSNAAHSRSLNYHSHEGNTSSNFNNKGMQQSRSNAMHPAKKYPSHSLKGEKLPALTPEQAIRLVMERKSYMSDSERTEDPDPISSRKASISTSSNDTAVNTVASDSGHNRTPEGKRVLVLKKKKRREDTHPRTSKIKNYHQRNPQEPHRRPSRQQSNVGNHLVSQRKNEEDEIRHGVNSQVHTYYSKKVEKTHSSTIESARPAKADASMPCEYLTPAHWHSVVEENEKPSHTESKQREEDKIKKTRDSIFREQNDGSDVFGNGQVEDDDRRDNMRTSIDNRSQASNSFFKEAEHEESSNENAQRRAPPSALCTEDLTEKEIILFDISDNDYCSDSDTDKHDDDYWGGHEDITQRPSNRSGSVDTTDVTILSMLETQEDKDDDIDSLAGEEEDWRNMSWKTAKTSRSVLSKYSKSSSVSLWMKNMGEVDSGNIGQDDDIFFFDAIQEAGKTSSSESASDTDNNDSNNDAVRTEEDEGWRGKITSLVGYTIGALTGSNDAEDDGGGDNDGVGTTPVSSTRNPTSPGKSTSPISGSTKAVPSRELEIIRKCQLLMKSQQNLMQTRERDAARKNVEDIRLQRKEDAARVRVYREVMAYREMMEGMGKSEKLAPLNSKAAAQEYDDRLAMVKTLEDQEKKMLLHERNMMEMEMVGNNNDESIKGKSYGCSCIIS